MTTRTLKKQGMLPSREPMAAIKDGAALLACLLSPGEVKCSVARLHPKSNYKLQTWSAHG